MRIVWNGEDAFWGSAEARAFSVISLPPANLSLSFSNEDEVGLTGSGSRGDPYILRQTDHLELLQTQTSAHFLLGKNVALPPTWVGADLLGSLDGNGYHIDATGSTVEKGLFDRVLGSVERFGIVGGTFFHPDGENAYKAPLCRQLGQGFTENIPSSITDCYARNCTVNTGGDRAGGLVGIQANVNSHLHRVYAACNRFGADGSRVGGVRGFWDRGNSSFGYWDSDLWASTSDGSRIASRAFTPKSTAEMHDQESYDGFDFNFIWRAVSANYPNLRQMTAMRLAWDEVSGWWDDYEAIHVVYEIKRNGRALATRHPRNSYLDTSVDFARTYQYDVRARLYVISQGP